MLNGKSSRVLLSLFMASSLFLTPACAEDFDWPSESDSAQKTPTKEAETKEAPASAQPALKMETPQTSSGQELKEEKASPAPSTQAKPKSQARAKPRTQPKAKTITLFGRLDQIASEADVKMPVLKAQKAQLDTSQPLRGNATRLTSSARDTRLYTGTQTRSFPVDFSGVWGGQLKVWRYTSTRLSDQLDHAETEQMAKILRPGKEGNVNFVFRQVGSAIDLEPAQVRLTIPASQSYSYKKMIASNPQISGLGGMVSNMMSNMQIPVILHFGTISTRGSAEVGISGNQIDQRVVKNVIRRLAPRVLEEQIVTKDHSVVASTGRSKDGYTESVIRFTRQSPNQLYVLAASVDYSADKRFMRKLIMYGTVTKGRRVNTSAMPEGMGQLSSLMGAGGARGGAGGLGSMGNLSSMLNSISGGGGIPSSYGSNYMRSGGANQTANYSNMLRSLQSGGGLGSLGARGQGFSQVLKSLNMITR